MECDYPKRSNFIENEHVNIPKNNSKLSIQLGKISKFLRHHFETTLRQDLESTLPWIYFSEQFQDE